VFLIKLFKLPTKPINRVFDFFGWHYFFILKKNISKLRLSVAHKSSKQKAKEGRGFTIPLLTKHYSLE
jgi:hypothetical protein